MFTGIINYLGKLNNKKGAVFTFSASQTFCKKISQGDSIAVSGVCLTVLGKSINSFSVELIPETFNKTALGHLKPLELVNLELPVTAQSFLSGHLVQGHVDGVAKLTGLTKHHNSRLLKFSAGNSILKYMAKKGSVAINGISLTIIETDKDLFTVGIIPYTWNTTMLHAIKVGNFVNIEVDILAKYVKKFLE